MRVTEIPRSGLSIARQGITRRLSFIEKRTATRLSLLPEVVRPVVILPGLLGTWPPAAAPRGRLDPLTKTYHNWVDGLRRIGYVPGVSLFIFPYDWRRSVTELAGELAAEIGRIRQLSPEAALKRSSVPVDYSQVDLVGHSMGGMIARSYVQSEAYAGDVARMLLVAVPQRGSLSAYYAYEGGDSTLIGLPIAEAQAMVSLLEAYETKAWQQRANGIYHMIRRQNMPDLYAYMRQHFPAVRNLLPMGSQNYLYRVAEAGQEQVYPFGPPPGYPLNPLVEDLNRPEKMALLDRVREIHCLYSSTQPTLVRLEVEAPQQEIRYQYGQPVTPQPDANYGPGDGVVAVDSARLSLPECKPDGQPWQVKVYHEDMSAALQRTINHVEIAADPAPVRHLLNYFTRPGLAPLDATIWDGPPLAARKLNVAALFI
jgi:hypothetical protein